MQINTDKFLYPDITVKHLKLMIHAIGLNDERPKRSRYGEYYYPFRNYYNAGEVSNEWEELVKLGYATKTGKATYCVTLGGLNAISNLIDVHIYSSAARYKERTLREVFNFLCKASVFCGYGCWIPISCKECATQTRIPLHKVREAMHALIKDGYVCETHYSGYDDYSLRPIYTRGYECTEKARLTEVYHRAMENEQKRVREMLERTPEWND